MQRSLLFLFPLLLLTACAPSRGTADSKLAVACQAAVTASFTDPKDHIDVQNASYSFVKSYDGAQLRVVTLKARYTYGTSDPDDRTYTCRYTEEWSLYSWLPEFYNLERDTQKFGNINGTISGDTDVIAKITAANDQALH